MTEGTTSGISQTCMLNSGAGVANSATLKYVLVQTKHIDTILRSVIV